MNLNYCMYSTKNNNSWADVVDESFDFNIDGEVYFNNTKCFINTNRLINISYNDDTTYRITTIKHCLFKFVDGEVYTRYIYYRINK